MILYIGSVNIDFMMVHNKTCMKNNSLHIYLSLNQQRNKMGTYCHIMLHKDSILLYKNCKHKGNYHNMKCIFNDNLDINYRSYLHKNRLDIKIRSNHYIKKILIGK